MVAVRFGSHTLMTPSAGDADMKTTMFTDPLNRVQDDFVAIVEQLLLCKGQYGFGFGVQYHKLKPSSKKIGAAMI